MSGRELLSVVVAGHVDHGKSTVMGRLFADTGALPDGKLEAIRQRCESDGKAFEYAFLLDALKDEQKQGITIDSARAFFSTKKRDYIIIDAPGHIEFLKNMISGAARAEAAVLVIDADEGVRQNSKRHGYMLSLLGIRDIIIVVNKMDLVGYDEGVFDRVKKEYMGFLKKIGATPLMTIPASALEGENIAKKSGKMRWYTGLTVIEAMESLEKRKKPEDLPLRMPVQNVYRFSSDGDKRRIIAGRVESGTVSLGDEVVFLPLGKTSRIKSIEGFNEPARDGVSTGMCAGLTLDEQIYVTRGQMMCKVGEKQPHVSPLLRANLFWMGKRPMEPGREYALRLETSKVPVRLKSIIRVLDCSDLTSGQKNFVERHDVAECILECSNPIAYDLASDIQNTSRFVIVDVYDLAGGGIIVGAPDDPQMDARKQVLKREGEWYGSDIGRDERAQRYGQNPRLILLTGPSNADKKSVAKALEKSMFDMGRKVYYLGIGNLLRGLSSDIKKSMRHEHVRRLGEVAHIMMDAGLIVIATASELEIGELELLKTIIHQDDIIRVYVDSGSPPEEGVIDLELSNDTDACENADYIVGLLKKRGVMFCV